MSVGQFINRLTGFAGACAGQPCYYCGLPATHLCNACGHCICDRFACGQASVAEVAQNARERAAQALGFRIRRMP
jgi:hypothetical protein